MTERFATARARIAELEGIIRTLEAHRGAAGRVGQD